MDEIAERYVRLALALGRHDPDYVDAYYGPVEWRERADAEDLDLDAIAVSAREALADLVAAGARSERGVSVVGQLTALAARAECLSGHELAFDAESAALYGVVAPSCSETELAGLVTELDGVLPGAGGVGERYAAFSAEFVVPPDRLRPVVAATMRECRRRTAAHIDLPDGEDVDLAFVADRPASGESRYLGNAQSRIEISTELPLRIDEIVDLAAHEGYPGHHVASTLIDGQLVRGRGWVEFTMLALYSPLAMVMEGTAVLAPDVAFPGADRLAYERSVLYPLAGLDGARAEEYHRVKGLLRRLGRTEVEVARRYLSGSMHRREALRWLTDYKLLTPARAERQLSFAERYRSYVINYSLGRDLVRRHLDAAGGSIDQPDKQWMAFATLLASPVSMRPATPTDLAPQARTPGVPG